MDKTFPDCVAWRTSSRSMDNPIRKNCVEVGAGAGAPRVFIRDSQNRGDGALALERREMTALLRAVVA
ncbi:DUF397 domain-containing protein [Nocardiopsis sp. YSL2]|uniref:DUF397 domain-containing protein n=1 Tax=Nocardiopsis sp. YSL2 TaxID=2939492 RepID=UPI0026F45C4D|nr:DUF397 domain-containing protein [Nocardiopsis sp. YSL2]